MRDLLVTSHTPVLRSGRALRTYGIARALASNGGLDLLYARFEDPVPDAAFSSITGVELHVAIPSRGPQRLLAFAAARRTGVPSGIARGVSPELVGEAERLAGAPGRGRVIADGPVAAAALSRLAQRRPVIYNAHNFESGFRHELDRSGHRERDALRTFERRLLERASESWMVSEPDLAAARELSPEARLRYVPNVVDVQAIAPVPQAPDQRAIFVANFAYTPNRDGLRFLLEEVFPRVWVELPEARLALVGAGLDEPPSHDRRVESVGFVADLREAYARARCAVVPLQLGGGTPLKLIEALAYGLPVIATRRATAGLGLRDGEHCLIADDDETFARELIEVLRDGAPELGRRGRELAAERYSIETLSRLLRD